MVRVAGVAVMEIPRKRCPTLLSVDGLRCMAIETMTVDLTQQNHFPRTFIPGDVISRCTCKEFV
jgi:hypothetical protein